MQAIVERAAQLDLDVLALQEVWTRRAEAALLRAGAAAGYRSLWPSGRGAGGLMALSRHEATSVEFTEFAVGGLPQRFQHADYYGNKGYALAQLDTGSGSLAFLVTHLHARYAAPGAHDEYLGIRAAQVAELAGRIDDIGGPMLAVGDFNMREGEAEYECFVGSTGLVDAAALLDSRQNTVVTANPYVGAGHHGDERIDYVFVNRAVEPVTVARDFHEPLGRYSDHAGVVTTIDLSHRPAVAGKTDANERVAARNRLGILLSEGRSVALLHRRRHRLRAAGLLAAAVVSSQMRERAVAGLLVAWAAAEAVLAERFMPAELRGLEYAQRIVERLAAQASSM